MMQTEYNGARGPVQALWIAFVREVGRENCIGEFDVFPPAYCNRAAFIVRHSVFFFVWVSFRGVGYQMYILHNGVRRVTHA